MKHQRAEVFDTETLQADVMRFLAIIAFCLIAILALVEKLPEQVVAEPEPAVIPEKELVLPEDQEEIRLDEVVQQPVAKEPTETIETVSSESITTESSEPLSLRFESDAAFLQLIHREQVVLYTRIDDQFLKMDPSFRLNDIELSGELYEVMETTLPIELRNIIERRGAADLYLVRLPDETAKRIGQLSERFSNKGGVLVIDVNGGVSHES